MSTLQLCKTAISVAALFAVTGSFGAALSKPEYAAAKERIAADYKTERATCDRLSGNAKDVCKEQATGTQDVARAELEYRYSGHPGDATKLAVARADATYGVAKERCDDKSGNVKNLCVAEAQAAHTKALADATLNQKVGQAKQDAAQDKDAADYRVATEKCDSLGGDAKASCLTAAKARFNKI